MIGKQKYREGQDDRMSTKIIAKRSELSDVSKSEELEDNPMEAEEHKKEL